MSEALTYLLGALAALFSIINPLSASPVFVALTFGDNKEHRHLMARNSSIYMVSILLFFLIAGSFIMQFFNISLEGLRITGGLVIVRAGYQLLNSNEKPNLSKESRKEGLTKMDISLTPLAIPLLAGPGSMAAIITMSTSVTAFYQYFIIALAIIIVGLTVFISFKVAPRLLQVIGTSGIEALTKIMGFITMAIGVQFILNGLLPILKIANAAS